MTLRRAIWLFVAFVLTLGLSCIFRGAALTANGPQPNDFSHFMFASQSQCFPVIASQIPAEWRSRYLACALSGAWLDFWHPKTDRAWLWVFGAYHALFVFGVFLLLIFSLPNPLLPMLGVTAGLMCNSFPNLFPYVMPWDMPVMLCWTAAYLAYRCRNWRVLIAAVFIGALFKETALVASLLLLGAPWRWQIKLAAIGGLFAFTHVLNELIMPTPATPGWILDFSPLLHAHWSSAWRCCYAVLADGGALVLLLFCLIKKPDWPLAITVLAFFSGMFLAFITANAYLEFRDWDELLPLAWITVNDLL
jgi:hypothetical protein